MMFASRFARHEASAAQRRDRTGEMSRIIITLVARGVMAADKSRVDEPLPLSRDRLLNERPDRVYAL